MCLLSTRVFPLHARSENDCKNRWHTLNRKAPKGKASASALGPRAAKAAARAGKGASPVAAAAAATVLPQPLGAVSSLASALDRRRNSLKRKPHPLAVGGAVVSSGAACVLCAVCNSPRFTGCLGVFSGRLVAL